MVYEEERAHVNRSSILKRDRCIIPNRNKLAGTGYRAGRDKEVGPQRGILGDPRIGLEYGAPKAGKEAEPEEGREIHDIDPLALPYV